MGWASESALETMGFSTSGGKPLCALDTRSRTSLAALSISISKSNSIVMVLLPSLETEVKDRIPDIPFIDSSKGSVIWDSITSALAPI